MAVYVDQLHVFGGDSAPRCFRNKPSCHMYADTPDELHAMASAIGLKRSWFQERPDLPHYDLVPAKRAWALRLGALTHTDEQMVAFRRARIEGLKVARHRCICEHAADNAKCPIHGGWPKSEDCNDGMHSLCDRDYCECICHKEQLSR